MAKAIHKFITIASLLVTATPILPAMAQSAEPSAIPRGREPVRIPCCRCLDGRPRTVSIDTGPTDWVVAMPGSTTFQPVAGAGNAAWTPVPNAGWVGPGGNPGATGTYTYQLQFHVPRCRIAPQVTVSGRFAADNSATVRLDGTQIAASQGTPDYGFLAGSVTPFTATAGTGPHTLQVLVTNSGGPTGMILQGSITIHCPRELEHRAVRDLEAAPVREALEADPPQ